MDRYRYALRKLTQSQEDVVSLDQAKHNCSVDGSEHDDAITRLLWEAREFCEEKTDCSLLATSWEMTMDAFPRDCKLYLPRWPLQSVTEVNYVDTAGSSQTIPAEDLVLRIDDHGRGRLALKKWAAWPSTDDTPDAVRIEFVAGWANPESVPPVWSRAILMLTAWWFEQREAGVIGVSAVEAPIGVQDLLDSVATADDFEEFEL